MNIITNAGLLVLLGNQFKTNPANLTLQLFKNNIVPDKDSELEDFTIADFTSYVDKTLTTSTWTAPEIYNNKAQISYPEQTWTNTGASQTIYGVLVKNASGTVIFTDRFGSPRVLGTGQSINYTPILTSENEI